MRFRCHADAQTLVKRQPRHKAQSLSGFSSTIVLGKRTGHFPKGFLKGTEAALVQDGRMRGLGPDQGVVLSSTGLGHVSQMLTPPLTGWATLGKVT